MNLNRAYSLLTIKAVDEDQRIIEGMATTPTPDRMGDIVDPMGAIFKLPLPLLSQHESDEPIGWVTAATPTAAGIRITAKLASIAEPGRLKDCLDKAWQSIKLGLVRGLSIGFRGLDVEDIPNSWSVIFKKWEWLELSVVTIPANAEATITTIRSIAASPRAASGQSLRDGIRLPPPGVSGMSLPRTTPKEGNDVKTIAQQITDLEALRGPKMARLQEISQKSIAESRTMSEAEAAEYDPLDAEVDALDADIRRLKSMEAKIAGAVPVVRTATAADASATRGGAMFATVKDAKPEPGIRLARLVRCKALARLEQADVARIAEREYGTRDPFLVEYVKAGEVPAMMVGAGGTGFIPTEVGFGDYAEFLRPATIVGKFGLGNVPALRRVPFRSGLVSMGTGSAGYWVGEAKPKPVSLIASARTHLTPLKVAAIIVLTMELIRDSSPSAEMAIRQDMTDAITATLDLTFIDPTLDASAGISPASITFGQSAIASTGTDADAVRLDIRALFAKFAVANNPAADAVLVMGTNNARALALMTNALGQPEFPGMTVKGGMVAGVPVIVSDHVGSYVALVSASDIYLADDGEVAIDMSTEASIEMKDSTHLTQHADGTSAGSAMVSLWQGNLAGFRAERTINWAHRRPVAAPYLTGVAWGEAVPAS